MGQIYVLVLNYYDTVHFRTVVTLSVKCLLQLANSHYFVKVNCVIFIDF